MDFLKKEKKEKFATQFSRWEKTLAANKVQNLEALYKKIHAEIRKSPLKVKVEKKQ
jgi:RNAse (barnase) inhibitor barstar